MTVHRLSPLDASFLAAETPTAHMHVGWAAILSAPEDGADLPTFAELRAHVASRLDRAPRYTQRLENVPLGVHAPVWVDDDEFDLDRHLRHSVTTDLDALVAAVMSEPLPRDRPLWQIWIADRLDDGRLGLVGKAHHCMVDGLAAVELGTLLLDAEPVRPPLGRSRRFARTAARPTPAEPVPAPAELLRGGVLDRLSEQVRVVEGALRTFAAPWQIPGHARRFARTLAHAALPPAPESPLNVPGSPRRHLARLTVPLDDLRAVKDRFSGTTVNDVVLAACAGALRDWMRGRGEEPTALKAMVPVSVRADDAEAELGNRISFMFVELPCQELDPVVRLMLINRDTASRKRAGEPSDADAALQVVGYAPLTVQRAVTHLVSSARMFNLVVSNIPGPRAPLYLRGCRLEEAWPVVPLADRHALSIGMTTICEKACFGLYADTDALPDADAVAIHLERAIDELLVARDLRRFAQGPQDRYVPGNHLIRSGG